MAKRKPDHLTKPAAATSIPPLRLEWIEAGSLAENPANWRRHSQEQLSSIRSLLVDPDVGWAGACLFNERTGRLVDGHARRSIVDPKTPIPVLVGNWSEEAERKILATLDPLAMMAEADSDQLRTLLEEVSLDGALQPIDDLLSGLTSIEDAGASGLRTMTIKSPPRTTWVLIGIPTTRFGDIAGHVESIASVPGTIVETTSNDAEVQD